MSRRSLFLIAALASFFLPPSFHGSHTPTTDGYYLSVGVDTANAKPKFFKNVFKKKGKAAKAITPTAKKDGKQKSPESTKAPTIKFDTTPSPKRDFSNAAAGQRKASKQKLSGRRIVSGLAVKVAGTFRGMSYRKAIKTADKIYKKNGWKKEKMNDGNGYKYSDPKNTGTKIFINKGYKKTKEKDGIHGGPYIKISAENTTQRIPLKGNPVLRN